MDFLFFALWPKQTPQNELIRPALSLASFMSFACMSYFVLSTISFVWLTHFRFQTTSNRQIALQTHSNELLVYWVILFAIEVKATKHQSSYGWGDCYHVLSVCP